MKAVIEKQNEMQAVMGLRESSWDIFYGLLSQHMKEYLPIIYTPYSPFLYLVCLEAIAHSTLAICTQLQGDAPMECHD